jgi:hypothetical protein
MDVIAAITKMRRRIGQPPDANPVFGLLTLTQFSDSRLSAAITNMRRRIGQPLTLTQFSDSRLRWKYCGTLKEKRTTTVLGNWEWEVRVKE